ncbi:MAG: hypothetical protein ABJ201_08805, partial [Nisaea sp.]
MMRIISIALTLAVGLGACAGTSLERRTAHTSAHFEAIRGDHTLTRSFLQEMPKGADLHTHLSGAV